MRLSSVHESVNPGRLDTVLLPLLLELVNGRPLLHRFRLELRELVLEGVCNALLLLHLILRHLDLRLRLLHLRLLEVLVALENVHFFAGHVLPPIEKLQLLLEG